jgi:hypothetical protein
VTEAKTAPKKAAKKAAAPLAGESGFDWQAVYPGEEVFVFTASDGKTVGLAALGPTRKFKAGEIRRARHLNEVDQMFVVLERVMNPVALAISDEFEDEDYGRMFGEWSEWANTSSGES